MIFRRGDRIFCVGDDGRLFEWREFDGWRGTTGGVWVVIRWPHEVLNG